MTYRDNIKATVIRLLYKINMINYEQSTTTIKLHLNEHLSPK